MAVIAIILSILFGSYVVLTALDRRAHWIRIQPDLRGRLSLALVFAFTGLSHFIQTVPMANMLPPWVPMRVSIIYGTGVMELAAAVALLTPRVSRLTGMCLIVFLVAVFPANVYGAMNQVDMGGHSMGPAYLLTRAPLQIILIGWTYGSRFGPLRGKLPHSKSPCSPLPEERTAPSGDG